MRYYNMHHLALRLSKDDIINFARSLIAQGELTGFLSDPKITKKAASRERKQRREDEAATKDWTNRYVWTVNKIRPHRRITPKAPTPWYQNQSRHRSATVMPEN